MDYICRRGSEESRPFGDYSDTQRVKKHVFKSRHMTTYRAFVYQLFLLGKYCILHAFYLSRLVTRKTFIG